MLRRMLCLLCMMLLLVHAVPAFSESSDGNNSYDFDLTFFLNADSFPALLRSRAAGYASLINRLGIRGNLTWSSEYQTFDLDSTIYYTDNPSLFFPVRIYGMKARVFITSPLINNEVILLNMAALMEFSVKAKNILGIPLPYLALLFPYVTESGLAGFTLSWQDVIGTFSKSGKISTKKISKLSDLWTEVLLNNNHFHNWISGVAGGSETPEIIELEFENLPRYLKSIANGKPVSVTVTADSETWKTASGDTLFSRRSSDNSSTATLSLPASLNGYIPAFSSSFRYDDSIFSFDVGASVCRDEAFSATSLVSADNSDMAPDEYAYETDDDEEAYEEYDYEDEDETDDGPSSLPDTLLKMKMNGTGFPRRFPADSNFSLSLSIRGTVYPNCSFGISGETKQDGVIALSLSKPFSSNTDPVVIFRCAGTVLPATDPKVLSDFLQEDLEKCYNVFSFNETRLAAFTEKVLPPLIKSIVSFVAAAPTSACQSFLDDLTEIGVLDMLLD